MKTFTFKFLLLFSILCLSNGVLTAQTLWTKYSGNPVLTPGSSGEWDGEGVALSSVIYDGNAYKMWYSGWDGLHFRIGYATSRTELIGQNMMILPPPIRICESDAVANLPGTWENNWVYAQSIYFDGSTYHIWYIGNEGTRIVWVMQLLLMELSGIKILQILS